MALTKIQSSGIAANAITRTQLSAATLANILIAGDNIAIAANGRISSTASLTSETVANVLIAGDNITIAANGRISSTATGGGGGGGGGSGVILFSNTTISSNILIGPGQNGLSIGPVTVTDPANVTIATGQRWLIL